MTGLSELVQRLLPELLLGLIIAGWVIIILLGIEPDKPRSGGIPGHIDPSQTDKAPPEGSFGRLGTVGAWFIFGAMSLSLPAVLVWIFRVHG